MLMRHSIARFPTASCALPLPNVTDSPIRGDTFNQLCGRKDSFSSPLPPPTPSATLPSWRCGGASCYGGEIDVLCFLGVQGCGGQCRRRRGQALRALRQGCVFREDDRVPRVSCLLAVLLGLCSFALCVVWF